MKKTESIVIALLALLLVPAMLFSQEQAAEHGSMELGVRHVWGDVYGRPDLPFRPSLSTSKLNEYQDLTNGFFIRNFSAGFENLLGSRNFLAIESVSTLLNDQAYLATVGQYGKYRVQFRYDATPHIYTDTARTLFADNGGGVYTMPLALRTTLQNTAAGSIPATVSGLVPSTSLVTPSIVRKTGSVVASYNVNEDWNLGVFFSREKQAGSRPIGYVMNSSPSASASAGYGVELPEPINYYTNNLKLSTEYGKEHWVVQAAYLGSFFKDNISHVAFDNPFNTVDAAGKPATGVAALYPNNSAHNASFAGAADLSKYVRVMVSVTPGWMKQDEAYLPYTSNSVLAAQTGALPATSLNGSRHTLAMNYTATSRPLKNVEVTARYRSYDFNNDTPVLSFTPVEGDAGAPNLAEPAQNVPYAFFKKNLEVAGTWFFTKKNSVKLGYDWEGFDREHRDVGHTSENSIVSAVDLNPRKDLLFRLSYRHSDRRPDRYENENEDMMPEARRFDESARIRDRADAELEYSPLDALTFSASFGTTQDNYNVAANSVNGDPYAFLTGSAMPYYSYGLLKDIGYNYDLGVDWAATNRFSVFADYTREKYKTNMVSRQRNVNTVAGAELFDVASDTPGNDWTSANRDIVDTYSTGLDLFLSKRVYLTAFYNLSASEGYNRTAALGTAAMYAPGGAYYVAAQGAIPASKFLVTSVLDFPETTSRIHEVGAIFKFKLTKSLMPKFEYRYQQFDSRDYQTSPMTPYMGMSDPTKVNYYPYLNVYDASAARFLFLGADNPSYRAHLMSASLEYHF